MCGGVNLFLITALFLLLPHTHTRPRTHTLKHTTFATLTTLHMDSRAIDLDIDFTNAPQKGLITVYLIEALFYGIICAGFTYRYVKTRVRYYLWLCLAAMTSTIIFILLSLFHLDSLARVLWMLYIFSAVYAVNCLTSFWVIVCLTQDWLKSLRHDQRLDASRRVKVHKTSQVLKFAYPVGIFALLCSEISLIFSFSLWIFVYIFTAYSSILVLVMFALVVWLWLGIRGFPGVDLVRKKNQILRLCALLFFSSASTIIFGWVETSVSWLIWSVIALWPGALVGYDEPPSFDEAV